MEFVFDVQGFKYSNNKFIAKEISAICLQDEHVVTHLFEPPFAWNKLSPKDKATNNWLTRHYHKLRWNNGFLPYHLMEDVVKSMLQEANLIYVKGEEKKRWLREVIGGGTAIIDLHDAGCESLSTLSHGRVSVSCAYHEDDTKYICARKNIEMLGAWVRDNTRDV